jgi:hypothetical protein
MKYPVIICKVKEVRENDRPKRKVRHVKEDRQAYREKKSIFDEKINRIIINTLECMNKEEILLSEVDQILYKIKAATTNQAEATLKETIVKVLV